MNQNELHSFPTINKIFSPKPLKHFVNSCSQNTHGYQSTCLVNHQQRQFKPWTCKKSNLGANWSIINQFDTVSMLMPFTDVKCSCEEIEEDFQVLKAKNEESISKYEILTILKTTSDSLQEEMCSDSYMKAEDVAEYRNSMPPPRIANPLYKKFELMDMNEMENCNEIILRRIQSQTFSENNQ